MPFGEPRQRTVFYGAVLMLAAFLLVGAAAAAGSLWLRIPLAVLALAGGLVGFVMTFRDYS